MTKRAAVIPRTVKAVVAPRARDCPALAVLSPRQSFMTIFTQSGPGFNSARRAFDRLGGAAGSTAAPESEGASRVCLGVGNRARQSGKRISSACLGPVPRLIPLFAESG